MFGWGCDSVVVTAREEFVRFGVLLVVAEGRVGRSNRGEGACVSAPCVAGLDWIVKWCVLVCVVVYHARVLCYVLRGREGGRRRKRAGLKSSTE